jgi:large subunit ribosomal protein L35
MVPASPSIAFADGPGFAVDRLYGGSRKPFCFNRSMPKVKTHSGAKKRFRKTASGRLRGRHAFRTHILGKKAAKRKRRLNRPYDLTRSDAAEVRDLLAGKGRKR